MSAPVAEIAPARRRGPGRALGTAAVPLLLLLALLAAVVAGRKRPSFDVEHDLAVQEARLAGSNML